MRNDHCQLIDNHSRQVRFCLCLPKQEQYYFDIPKLINQLDLSPKPIPQPQSSNQRIRVLVKLFRRMMRQYYSLFQA